MIQYNEIDGDALMDGDVNEMLLDLEVKDFNTKQKFRALVRDLKKY